MNKILLSISVALFSLAAMAQVVDIDPISGVDYGESCTALLVGKKASTDGSTMTSHSCDGNYTTWTTIIPAKTNEKGSLDTIYWNRFKSEEPHDMRGVTIKGTIPAAQKTYRYVNVGYPCLNEKQLAIGETTFGGRKELKNEDGLLVIEELQRIVLQRTSTAREAIKLIGELVAEYGYGDAGECLTFADKNEVWQLEITGSGAGKPSALWVAQRVPDDHIGISANIPRISTVDFNNPNYFMYSADLKKRAKDLGYWDGKEPFKFWKVVMEDGKKPFAIRDYFILNMFAPSLNLSMDMDELPFSVKPDRKISPEDAISIYRQQYEGTPYDMSQNLKVAVKGDTIVSPIVNNWMSADFRNLINAVKPETIAFQRTVGVCWCAYSHIIQVRGWLPDEIGGVMYYSVDNPAQSPRIPIYAGTTELPAEYAVCGQKRYRDDALLWRFREANRLAQVAWGKSRESMESEQLRLERKMFDEQAAVEAHVKSLLEAGKNEEAAQYLNNYTADFTGTAIYAWERLKRKYWAMFGRGF